MTGTGAPAPSVTEWAFEVYARAGVEAACLELQDRHGIDVVALLWCTWAGLHHGSIDPTVMRRVLADLATWQRDVVGLLRTVRRGLKSGRSGVPAVPGGAVDALRAQVAAAEVAAETIGLDHLDHLDPVATFGGEAGAPAVRSNIEHLLDASDAPTGPDVEAALDRYLAAMSPRAAGS